MMHAGRLEQMTLNGLGSTPQRQHEQHEKTQHFSRLKKRNEQAVDLSRADSTYVGVGEDSVYVDVAVLNVMYHVTACVWPYADGNLTCSPVAVPAREQKPTSQDNYSSHKLRKAAT